MYSGKVMEHFKNPKFTGDIKNADGTGKVGNPVCGDVMEIYIKVGKNKEGKEFLEDVKVKTFGCVSAIASSDVLCEMVRGKTLDEALKVTNKNVVNELGGLPPAKIHCSVLAADALKKAIEDYRKNKK
ncbi:iron-sulfur cluster assembly scaffold protein [Candidatus Woesearchaeota archaeon]|nr:iron-sulfur cluster assembly scaffold protein [Candidatus Woesearchaeota archaeon]